LLWYHPLRGNLLAALASAGFAEKCNASIYVLAVEAFTLGFALFVVVAHGIYPFLYAIIPTSISFRCAFK